MWIKLHCLCSTEFLWHCQWTLLWWNENQQYTHHLSSIFPVYTLLSIHLAYNHQGSLGKQNQLDIRHAIWSPGFGDRDSPGHTLWKMGEPFCGLTYWTHWNWSGSSTNVPKMRGMHRRSKSSQLTNQMCNSISKRRRKALFPWRTQFQEAVRGSVDRKKAAVWGEELIIPLTMTLAGLWCALFGVSWKSSGEVLAAGVEDVNAVSRHILAFRSFLGATLGKLISLFRQTLPRIPNAHETRTTSTLWLPCVQFTSHMNTFRIRTHH